MALTSPGESRQSASDTARAEATYVMARRAAAGLGFPQDWGAALNLLSQSAELGYPMAQSTLAALAGDWPLSRRIADGERPRADWARLRAAVDLAWWTATPRPRILSASPRVALVEGIASPELCEWVIAQARPKLAPAKIYDPETGGPGHSGGRTNSETFLMKAELDLILLFLRSRIGTATELPVGAMESPAILHYTPGQQFLPHFDFFDPAVPGYAKEMARGGQRVVTFLLCLNDDYQGGETDFPALGKRFKGRRGNGLFFWNVEPDGKPDVRTKHAGLPPTRGEKWILSQWIRGHSTWDG